MTARTASPERIAGCLSDDELAAFAAGELIGARALEGHLDHCESCRRAVSALAAVALDEVGAMPTDRGDAPGQESTQAGGPPMPLLATGLMPGERLGRFTVTRPLGHGAMGEVWAARDPELDREVALKLLRLRAETLGVDATARLRREAQAMARLSHPNVVAIYELGSDGDQVFCAMELIDGITLRRWLETPRGWREVVEVALAVGSGVAAAHAAGLVHRDIKPDNVLMARDGRTLVTDFGLAKLVELREDDAGDREDRADRTGLDDASVSSLTGTGMVIGTPAYMAPEQLEGGEVDTQSDQFSYCVTIYEALFGVRPFAGATLHELAAAMRDGPARPSARGKVPRPVIACLLRGLAADKQRRWPSMLALLAELRRRSLAPRRQRIALGVGLAVALGTGAVLWARPGAQVAEVRAAAESRISRAWGPSQRAVLQAAFAATRTSVAEERAATVVRLLDAYRAEWLAMRVDAWAATHVRREQTGALLERRLACFDDLADQLGTVVRLLSSPDAAEVGRAPAVVHGLEPISTCADVRQLEERSPPPSTPVGRAAEDDLRDLEALQLAGRRDEALARGTQLVIAAERVGDAGLLARATFNLGAAQANVGRHVEAEATLRRAVQQAAIARDHVLVAEAWLRLFDVVGRELDRGADALAFESAVRAAVAQAGDDPRQQAALATVLGLVASGRGDWLAAKTYFTEARDRHLAARGPDHPHVGNAENNLASALLQLGELDEATRRLERSLEIMEASMGPTNPVAGHTLQNLSAIAARRKDWPASERHLRAALVVNLAVLGPDHTELGRNHVYLARALREQRRFADAAVELAAARQIFEKALPPTHVYRLMHDIYEAQIAEDEGDLAKAERLGGRGLAALRTALPGDHPQLVFVIAEQARFVAHRSPAEALPLYDEALTLYTAREARDPAGDLDTLGELGRAALAAGKPEHALRWFDRLPAAAAKLEALRGELEAARRSRPARK